jgi:hypothetical protein
VLSPVVRRLNARILSKLRYGAAVMLPDRRLLRGFLVALAVASGCSPAVKRQIGEPPLCRINTGYDLDKPLVQRALPSPIWFSLIVRGYQANGEIPRPTQDCEGQVVAWTADACSEPDTRTLLPGSLSERDIVVSHLGEGRRLVWVITDRFVSGEALGPVALATFDTRGVSVDTLGVLRAYPSRAQLRLERLGDYQILVAEGESCADERDVRSCVQAVRLVPVGRRRFVPLDLTDVQGRCVGRTFFPLQADGNVGDSSHRRSYRLQRNVSFAPDAVVVQEQMSVISGSWGSSSVDAAASAVSRMTVDRRIRVIGGRLVIDEPSLLERFVRAPAPVRAIE